MDKALHERVALGARLAREAGGILLGYYGQLKGYENKGPLDLVTEADRASERFLVDALRSAFPDDGLLAEEDGELDEGTSGYIWMVDPLDGTTNFVHSHPQFGVSIGLQEAGVGVFGAVFAPIHDELFLAVRGEGATLNGRPIHVSRTAELEQALVASGFPYNRRERLDLLLARVARAISVTQGFRREGAAALDLCSVAAGRLDGFWEEGLNAWDLAAGIVIVEEAGGRVSSFDGGELDLFRGEAVVSNGLVHDALIRAVFPPSEGEGA